MIRPNVEMIEQGKNKLFLGLSSIAEVFLKSPAGMGFALANQIVPRIEKSILFLRDQRVMIDADLAHLYGISTKALNQAVKRNRQRFPADFMLQLTKREKQQVVTDCDHLRNIKFSNRLPYAFTEHGAIMLASVLNSPRAIEMSIYVVRAFVRLREWLASHQAINQKLSELESKVSGHDTQIHALITAIRELMKPPNTKKSIGFR